MSKLYRLFLFAFTFVPAAFAPVGADAADNVIVESSCDSVMMWIGEQSQIHISVTCDTGQDIRFPLFGDTIVNGLEIIPPVKTDTQYIDRKKRMTVTRNYTVTSFDSALYYIPPFEVSVDNENFRAANPLSLAVYMFEVDTLNTDQFFGPKDIMQQNIQWTDVKSPTFTLLFLIIAVVLLIFLFISWKNDKPIIRTVKIEPKKPAHEVAFAEMERIRQSKIGHGEDLKQYYTELTDAVRIYLNERFGINATEMTSDEIIGQLLEIRDKDSLTEMKELFATADLVKFAKFKPLLGENDRNLLTAVEFVKETMNTEEPVRQEPEEQVIVERKRSRESRAVLLGVVILLAVGSCTLLYLLLKDVYYLFF